MSANVTIKWHKPISQVIRDAGINAKTMRFAAREWYRLYFPFVPMDTGFLGINVEFEATEKTGKIRHVSVYARYQYNGFGFNFSRDKHPMASANWDKAAIAAGKKRALAATMQAFIKRG